MIADIAAAAAAAVSATDVDRRRCCRFAESQRSTLAFVSNAQPVSSSFILHFCALSTAQSQISFFV